MTDVDRIVTEELTVERKPDGTAVVSVGSRLTDLQFIPQGAGAAEGPIVMFDVSGKVGRYSSLWSLVERCTRPATFKDPPSLHRS